ncbi:hypothetical protein SCHPADRAFT_928776 [Schizopora paradoxa]|uniref:DUF6699 domain-containing protein n=1 Tax=Schizopora paradoxa TaxID=27342 RepID=A0A0H2RUH0_9AGAM|nr:hypothetical protein SCHPADRAFT_928776 [Schizopora paradoxa]
MTHQKTFPPKKRQKLSNHEVDPPVEQSTPPAAVPLPTSPPQTFGARHLSPEEVLSELVDLLKVWKRNAVDWKGNGEQEMGKEEGHDASELAAKLPITTPYASSTEFPAPTVTQLREFQETQCVDPRLLPRRTYSDGSLQTYSLPIVDTSGLASRGILYRMVPLTTNGDVVINPFICHRNPMDLGMIEWNVAKPPDTAKIFGQKVEKLFFDGAAIAPEDKMVVRLVPSDVSHQHELKITITPPSDSFLPYLSVGMVLQRLHYALQEPITLAKWNKLSVSERHIAVERISKRYPGKQRPKVPELVRVALGFRGHSHLLSSSISDCKAYRKALENYVTLGNDTNAKTIAQPLDLLGGNARFEGLKLIALKPRMTFELQTTPIRAGEEE